MEQEHLLSGSDHSLRWDSRLLSISSMASHLRLETWRHGRMAQPAMLRPWLRRSGLWGLVFGLEDLGKRRTHLPLNDWTTAMQ